MAEASISNGTEDGPSAPVTAAQTVLSVLPLGLSCCSNGLLLYLLCRCKKLRSTDANILVADLVTVDLLNLLINAPLFVCSAVLNVEALRGKEAGWWVSTLHVLFGYMTLTTMFLMMIDRFLIIRFPFRCKCHRTISKVVLAVVVKWVATLVTVFGVYVPLREIDLGERPVTEYRHAYSKANNVIGRILTPAVLAGSVVLFLVSRRSIQNSTRELLRTQPLGQHTAGQERKQKAINTIFITISIFCISYAPIVLRAAFPLGLKGSEKQWLVFALGFLLYLPAMSNSLIYFLRIDAFRSALTELVKGNSAGLQPRRPNIPVPMRELGNRPQDHVQAENTLRKNARRWSNVWSVETKSPAGGNQQTVNSIARRHSV